MNINEFKKFWSMLNVAFPRAYVDDDRGKFMEALKDIPIASAVRSVKTCTKHKEPPAAEYIAYLARECNGMPDLLYKAVQKNRETKPITKEEMHLIPEALRRLLAR